MHRLRPSDKHNIQRRLAIHHLHEWFVHSTSHLLDILLHPEIKILTRSGKAAETCDYGDRHLLYLLDSLMDFTIYIDRYYVAQAMSFSKKPSIFA